MLKKLYQHRKKSIGGVFVLLKNGYIYFHELTPYEQLIFKNNEAMRIAGLSKGESISVKDLQRAAEANMFLFNKK